MRSDFIQSHRLNSGPFERLSEWLSPFFATGADNESDNRQQLIIRTATGICQFLIHSSEQFSFSSGQLLIPQVQCRLLRDGQVLVIEKDDDADRRCEG